MNFIAAIPLARLAGELAAFAKAGSPPVSYRKLQHLVWDGRLPGAEQTNGRWSVSRAALPQIAAALGLTPANAQQPA